ncbi:MAG: TetR/AcrR family transcriptional regulator [Deltaproteobacteria bacterium]|nr:TetR/AcrR family transcriptional regulator [Deltaproteobacteria bacterium]
MTKKETILNVATKLFSEKGYRNTAIAELAKLTDVAEGTIFYHFKTKEGLFLAILENIRQTLISEFEAFFRGKNFESGLEMLEGCIFFYLYLVGTKEELFLILHRYDAYELAQVNPVFRKNFSTIYNFILDTFESAILRGRQDGSIEELPPGKTAFIVFAMVDGIARLKTFNLYDSSALFEQLIASCRRMLQKHPG